MLLFLLAVEIYGCSIRNWFMVYSLFIRQLADVVKVVRPGAGGAVKASLAAALVAHLEHVTNELANWS